MNGGSAATVVAEIDTKVSGEEVEASWTYGREKAKGTTATSGTTGTGGGQQLPAYVAEVDVEGYPLASVTGYLVYDDDLELELLRKEEGEPLADWNYTLRLSTGEIRTGTTDGEGMLKEEGVPPGSYTFL